MKKLHVTLNGTSPLIMHSPKCVNPLHPISKRLKEYTSKRKKTDEDLQIISDLEWESGVYWEDNVGLYIPNEAIAATLKNGAKMNKNGADVGRYCIILDSLVPLDIGEVQDYEKMKVEPRFRDVRSACVQRARVIRTRPRFNTWRCEFDMMVEDEKMNLETVALAFSNAGRYVGCLEMRSLGYGKFEASIQEVA